MQENKQSSEYHEKKLHALLGQFENDAAADYANLRITQLPRSHSAIAYYEYGDPKGTPLLCLHGLSVTGLYFEQYHHYFVQMGIRAIAPCLLGGIYLADSARTIDVLATDTIELLDRLGIDKFDVLGFSWGTLTELALLARIPHRIRKAGLLGAMTPLKFLDPPFVEHLKADVRQSLGMVRSTPWLHRTLMWLVFKLPIATLMKQFKDDQLSAAERNALTAGAAFYRFFARCMSECMRSGARFMTNGWRMFLDDPAYALGDLSGKVATVDVRLYVAEIDNVHLPRFSALIAAACTGANVDAVSRQLSARATPSDRLFNLVYNEGNCSAWMTPGAGRMACVLYFKEALQNLMLVEPRN